MKLLGAESLLIEEIKIIKFAKFFDHRGYFTEFYRKSDFKKLDFMKAVEFVQFNGSYSKKGVVRGLHFQWNPYMGKLVRVVSGRMIDMALDIRKGASTFGKIILYNMEANHLEDYEEWVWVPPGFAHGFVFTEATTIEYLCSGEYSPYCEGIISPLADDINWSMCDKDLKYIFDSLANSTNLITDKDKHGFSVKQWKETEDSNNFIYNEGGL